MHAIATMASRTRQLTTIYAGQPEIGARVMVRIHRGGDSKRRARFLPAVVYSVTDHMLTARACVVIDGRPSGMHTACRVVFAERYHGDDCTICNEFTR